MRPDSQASLSLMYLAAVARERGAAVSIYNMARKTEAIEVQHFPNARIYGLTGYHTQVNAVNRIAARLKLQNSSCKVVVGGPIWLSAPELNTNLIDTVVRGPGESVIPEVLAGNGAQFLDGEPVKLDTIPAPARDLWDGPLGGPTFLGRKVYFDGGSTPILSSRGCPNACAFCANPKLTGSTIRFRDPGSVVEEMEQVVTDFNIREFTFWDEIFNIRPERVLRLCDAICASGVLGHGKGVAWRATVAARPSSGQMWSTMRRAGCHEVSVGLESGDDRVLREMNKTCSVSDNEQMLREASESGLTVRGLMICGTPAQRPDTLKKDIGFICRNQGYLSHVAAMVFVPVPGCAIRDNPTKFACLLRDLPDKIFTTYRPDGLMQVEPHIESEHMDTPTLRRHMQIFLDFLDATGGLHRG